MSPRRSRNPSKGRDKAAKPPVAGNIRATRDDWLNAALDTLISDGVDSVRVLTLSQHLGVSRSSFYWYFNGRDDLLDQLLAFWREKNTRLIVERAGRPADTVIRSVMNIFACWVDEALFDPRLDFAIRSWALLSKKVRKIIHQADDERVNAICEMFRRHGYEAEDAFVRARILYYMQIGYYALDLHEPMDSRLSHVPAYLRSFTGQAPGPQDIADFRLDMEQRLARSPASASSNRVRHASRDAIGSPAPVDSD